MLEVGGEFYAKPPSDAMRSHESELQELKETPNAKQLR
jgi:hypothetical protein